MKSSRLMIAVAVALFVLAIPAIAQTGSVRVTVPFDFTVGKQTLAAGEYRVSVDSMQRLQIKPIGGTVAATVLTNLIGGNENQAPKLIFHRYGDHYFLAQVWTARWGHELFASAAELEYARTTKQDQTAVLASRLPAK